MVFGSAQAQDIGAPLRDDENLGVVEETLVVIDDTDVGDAALPDAAQPTTELAAIEVIAESAGTDDGARLPPDTQNLTPVYDPVRLPPSCPRRALPHLP